MKIFLSCVAPVLFVSLFAACSSEEAVDDGSNTQTQVAQAAESTPKGRVIILGFDGVDPGIVQTMMDAGELENLSKLAKQGTFKPLGSSNPPQSPTAWSSFSTSKHPGSHGIYDFLGRNPSTYIPFVGFGKPQEAVLNPDGSLRRAASFKSFRKGKSFWKIASDQSVRSKILSVPFAFPADSLEDGCMLAGLGVPDIRGTNSIFFYMSDTFSEKIKLSGGEKLPIVFEDDEATIQLEGLFIPKSKPRKYATAPLKITADREKKSAIIGLPSKTVTVKEGEWTEWLEWEFKITDKYSVHAISRIHVLEVGDAVRLYMTCLQFDPTNPYMEFTSPPEYSAELKERYGNFKTIGWIFDTHALRQGGLTEDIFLEDVENTMTWRETLTLDELDRGNVDLLVSAWTGTDRVGHMFWHHRDAKHPLYTADGNQKHGRAVENTYSKMDSIVGKVMEKLSDDDLFLVVSDHGFHSFRRGFNVNTWLVRNGYLAVRGNSNPATATNNAKFLRGYDWSKSKAYSVGLGSIFLNLKGREGKGSVDPAEADALRKEIREKLLKVKDPKTGDLVFTEIYTTDFYQGRATSNAPDLQLGYAEGYQSTKDAAAGVAPADLFEDNTDTWSGEHAASDMTTSAGILFSNKPIKSDSPHLVDIGVTALTYLGKKVPSDLEGKSLL
jgi:predicted AlkP superfamily phosphohydrolase/phosphomutase